MYEGAGTGDKVFCAGQDLKAWLTTSSEGKVTQGERIWKNKHGFGSLARRRSKKTLICALNGHAFGGGAELLFNCDIIIGVEGGIVCFPEVRRGRLPSPTRSMITILTLVHVGVVAGVGGIPNLMLRSPAMAPYLLAGLPIPQALLNAHVLTEVVPRDQVSSLSTLDSPRYADAVSPGHGDRTQVGQLDPRVLSRRCVGDEAADQLA